MLVRVMDAAPWLTTTVSLPPERVAVRPLGGAPFGPDSQCWMSELISARRHLHASRLVMRVPPVIRNGSGKFEIAVSAPKAGCAGIAGQSAPVFSVG